MNVITGFTDFFSRSDREFNTVEALTSSVEVATRLLLETHIVEAIPALGLVVKLMRAKNATSDHLLARKVEGFLQGTGKLTAQQREAAVHEMFEDRDEAQRAGEHLVMMLDRVTDTEKPTYLGKLFRHFASGRIDHDQLRRLSMAVENGFMDDLKHLLHPLQEERLSAEEIQDCRRRLMHTGLTSMHVYRHPGRGVVAYYQLTKTGMLFYELVNGRTPSLSIDTLFALENDIDLDTVANRRANKL